MNNTLPLVLLNSEAFLVRERCPSSVVYDIMVIAFTSMASWKSSIDVYAFFNEEDLMRGMSSTQVSKCVVMVSSTVCVDVLRYYVSVW